MSRFCHACFILEAPPDCLFPDSTSTKRQAKNAKGKEKQLKEHLDSLLAQPLVMRGISARYITSGGNSAFVESMLKGDSHDKLIGLPKTRAVDDL